MAAEKNQGIIIVGPAILNMPSLFEMSAPTLRDGTKGKATFNCELAFTLDIAEQKAALKSIQTKALEMVKAEFGPDADFDGATFQGRSFKFRLPWKDGTKKAAEMKARGKNGTFYEGKGFIRASTIYQPELGVLQGNQVRDTVQVKDFYSGNIVKAEVNIVAKPPFDSDEDAKGFIKAYLNAVVKVEDGERLGGRSSASILASVAGVQVQKDVDDDDDGGLLI